MIVQPASLQPYSMSYTYIPFITLKYVIYIAMLKFTVIKQFGVTCVHTKSRQRYLSQKMFISAYSRYPSVGTVPRKRPRFFIRDIYNGIFTCLSLLEDVGSRVLAKNIRDFNTVQTSCSYNKIPFGCSLTAVSNANEFQHQSPD